MKKHFNIATRYDLLEHCYSKFDKAFFASLCEKLSHLATNGDELCLHLFEEAGRYLARAKMALLPNVCDKLLINGNLNVVCVGSVWKSWNLLKDGFSKELAKSTNKFGVNLITLTQATAIGAAYLAADSIEYDLPRDYNNNYDIFHHFEANNPITTNATYTNGIGPKKIQTNGNMSNGSKYTNGITTNGIKTNGTTNGTTNGKTNGKTNGTQNGTSNGTTNGKHTNGTQTKKGLKAKANASPSEIMVQDG